MKPTLSKLFKPAIALTLTFFSAVLTADTYKLTINGSDSSQNVIYFQDSLPASVTMTADGMAIDIPGVDVTMRCQGNTASSTDECLFKIVAAEQNSTNTNTNTNTDTNTDTNNSSGDCSTGSSTWSNCDGGSDSDSSGNDSTSNDSTSNDNTSTVQPDGGCSNSSRISCQNKDYGPEGNQTSGSSSVITIPPQVTLVFPFTVKGQRTSGIVGWFQTSSEVPLNGNIRVWLSDKTGGDPLELADCAYNIGEGGLTWVYGSNTNNIVDCDLPATGTYRLHMASCTNPAKTAAEKTCRSSNTVWPTGDHKVYLNQRS